MEGFEFASSTSSPNVVPYDDQQGARFSTDETLQLARVGSLRNINDFLITLSASVRRHNADFQCLEIAYNAESKSIGYGLTRRGGRRRQEVFPHVFNDLNFKADYPTYFVWTIKGVFSTVAFRYTGSFKTKPGPRDHISLTERRCPTAKKEEEPPEK